jgi:hypothetical protein
MDLNKLHFDYNKYFDIPEGKSSPKFEHNDDKLNPHLEHYYFVSKIDNISDKKIAV